MKKLRKLSAIILAAIMALSVYSPTNATELVLQEASSKIKSDLQSVLLSSGKNDEIPVDIWLYEPFSTEQLEKEIDSKIGITKQKIKQSEEKAVSSEKVDEYIETERALYSKKMNALYKDFLKDYSKVKALNETRENKRLFFSQYAPLISAELTPAEIKQLAKDDRVQSIYYSPDVKAVPEGNVSVPLIQADFVRDDAEFTGVGIKIGLLEAYGLPHKNASFFTSANIIYDPSVPIVHDIPNYHPDRVAAIMVAKSTTDENGVSYKGIAPDAMLYATYINTTPISDWREKVEWLISSGVEIVNMSMALEAEDDEYTGLNNAKYGVEELWLDHIALNHCVHFVKSAGNRGEGDAKITSPGMAYNVITVGAINDMNTLAEGDDLIAYFSSYEEDDGLINKPDLVAPGTNITTPIPIMNGEWEDDGTSYAAPHVSAVIAELCEMQPYLKVEQETMKAILTASINHSEHAYTPANEFFYNRFGAGVINAKESFMTIAYSRYTSSSFAAYTPSSVSHTYNLNVYINLDPIRVSLSWLQYSDIPNEDHVNPNIIDVGDRSDLSLKIYDPNGNQVAFSDSNNNTEIVEFKPTVGGNYTIKVTTTNISDKTTYYGLAWAFIDDGID